MIRKSLACVVLAALLHAAVLLFGGAVKFLFVKDTGPAPEEAREVEVVEEKKEEKPEEKKQVEKVAKAEEEPLPDTSVMEAMEQQQQQAPALAQVSLADLESIGSGGGEGGGGFNLASGGMVGGTGAPGGSGGVDALMGGGAGMTKPRVVSSPSPEFPPAARRKGGSVALVVFVTESGKVRKVTVESCSEPALEQPAVEAIRRWTFEPATYQGRKVPGKVRQVIRLAPSNA